MTIPKDNLNLLVGEGNTCISVSTSSYGVNCSYIGTIIYK